MGEAERDTSLRQLETFLLLFPELRGREPEWGLCLRFWIVDVEPGAWKQRIYRLYVHGRKSVDVSGKDTELRGDFGFSRAIQKPSI